MYGGGGRGQRDAGADFYSRADDAPAACAAPTAPADADLEDSDDDGGCAAAARAILCGGGDASESEWAGCQGPGPARLLRREAYSGPGPAGVAAGRRWGPLGPHQVVT